MQRRLVFVVALVFLGVAACSSDPEPPVGSEGAHCYGNGTCDSSLVCLSDLCVRPADAGMDAGADAGPDAGPDPVDAGTDAGQDAHVPGCVADTYFCDTVTGSAHCNAAGTGIDLSVNCAATQGETCNPLTGECFVCVANTDQCYSTTVQSHCNATGTGYDGSLSCTAVYGTMCDPATGRCAGT